MIEQGLAGNLQLKILAEDIQIANNEILARKGAYLPFVTAGGGPSVTKPNLDTPEGAVEHDLHVLPGVPFPNPLPNYVLDPSKIISSGSVSGSGCYSAWYSWFAMTSSGERNSYSTFSPSSICEIPSTTILSPTPTPFLIT